jgi:predicted acylesterase/phospholipase RssA
MLTESVTEKVLVTSLDLMTGKLVYFQNDPTEDAANFLASKNMRALDVSDGATFADAALCTSAAPILFPTIDYKGHNLTDGGVAQNNPAQVATLLAMNGPAKDRPILVISLGTGRAAHEPITSEKSVKWGLVQWLQPLFDIIFDTEETVADLQMNLLAGSNPQVTYVRFQMILEDAAEAQLDNYDPANMQRLEELGTRTFTDFLENQGGNEKIIEPLKAAVRARSLAANV